MLWCAEKHVESLDEIIHHPRLISILKNTSYMTLQNLCFYGAEGSGKKTIVMSWINHIIIKNFNLKPQELQIQERKYIYINNKKEENLTYYQTPYYIHVDLAKLGKKKHVLFENVLEQYISKKRNIRNLPFNLVIFSNFDAIDDKTGFRFHRYMDKFLINTRFIFITNNPSITRHHKITSCALIRIPRLNKEELCMIVKYMLAKYRPKIKTTTAVFNKNFDKIIEFSKRHLSKTIFYTQLLYEYGMVQLKNIALRQDKTIEYLFSLITSNNMRNIQDMNKVKNSTQIRTYNTLKLRELVYQCSMGSDNYEKFICQFYKHVLKKHPTFVEKYNKTILKVFQNICASKTSTNKTSFILTECFFLKLMSVYSLDQLGINVSTRK